MSGTSNWRMIHALLISGDLLTSNPAPHDAVARGVDGGFRAEYEDFGNLVV